MKSPITHFYQNQIIKIRSKYENEEVRKCSNFYNYSSVGYVWHYLNM